MAKRLKAVEPRKVIALDKEAFQQWQIAKLAAENIALKAQRVVEEANQRVVMAATALGLEVGRTYDFDLKALTATEVPEKAEK